MASLVCILFVEPAMSSHITSPTTVPGRGTVSFVGQLCHCETNPTLLLWLSSLVPACSSEEVSQYSNGCQMSGKIKRLIYSVEGCLRCRVVHTMQLEPPTASSNHQAVAGHVGEGRIWWHISLTSSSIHKRPGRVTICPDPCSRRKYVTQAQAQAQRAEQHGY